MPHSIASSQRKVADDPGKQRSLSIARTGEKERRRRKIVDGRKVAKLAFQRLNAGNPNPCGLVVLLCFVLFLSL